MYNKLTENIVGVYCTIIIFSTTLSSGYAQFEDTTYSVTTYINLGYSRFITELDDNDLNKNGFSGTIRLMWEPEHLLSIGIESGYLQLYDFNSQISLEDGTTFNISSELTAVPILSVFSMEIFKNFNLSVGSGMFLLTSKVDALGNPVNSNQVSTGVLGSVSYYYPLSRTISLGGEVKYYLINKIEDGTLNFQISFQYNLFIY
jgi:hypothetical protein